MLAEHDGETIAGIHRIRPEILTILEDTAAGLSWFLTVARYEGCPRSSPPLVIPTVILFCTNPELCRTALEALDTTLRLEVKPGEGTFKLKGTLLPDNTDYVAKAHMGVSTGAERTSSSETFGGYVIEKSSKSASE